MNIIYQCIERCSIIFIYITKEKLFIPDVVTYNYFIEYYLKTQDWEVWNFSAPILPEYIILRHLISWLKV